MAALVVVTERWRSFTGEVGSLDDPSSVAGSHGLDGVEDDAVSAKLACHLSNSVDACTSCVEGRDAAGDTEDGHLGAEADNGAQNGGCAFLFLSHMQATASWQKQPSHD